MAKAVGLPKATAQRPPAANDIKPHVTKTFKVSHDLALVEKVWDVIGLGSLRRPAFLAEKVLTLILAAGVLLGLSMLEPLRIVPSLADRPGAYDLAVGTPFATTSQRSGVNAMKSASTMWTDAHHRSKPVASAPMPGG
jgi:hypothetical protein